MPMPRIKCKWPTPSSLLYIELSRGRLLCSASTFRSRSLLFCLYMPLPPVTTGRINVVIFARMRLSTHTIVFIFEEMKFLPLVLCDARFVLMVGVRPCVGILCCSQLHLSSTSISSTLGSCFTLGDATLTSLSVSIASSEGYYGGDSKFVGGSEVFGV